MTGKRVDLRQMASGCGNDLISFGNKCARVADVLAVIALIGSPIVLALLFDDDDMFFVGIVIGLVLFVNLGLIGVLLKMHYKGLGAIAINTEVTARSLLGDRSGVVEVNQNDVASVPQSDSPKTPVMEIVKQKLEIVKQKLEINKGGFKKTGIAISFVAGAVLLVVLVIFVAVPNYKYRKAINYMNDGKYDEAIALFDELGDFRDSRVKRNQALTDRWG